VKRFTPIVSQKSAAGKVGHAVGKASEALQCRKAEQQIGPAGNGTEGPNGPRTGINGVANRTQDS